ncbi:MAG: hypothetical protein RJA42_306 [Bacteroidota bacterium]
MKKLYSEHGMQELCNAINMLSDREVWDAMDAKQREKFFRDECKKFGLTIVEGRGANCLYVEEFKSEFHNGEVNPYFMFWKERNSDNQKAGIEFGHYHMNSKWDKEYPRTEYCFYGPSEHRKLMKKYVSQMK